MKITPFNKPPRQEMDNFEFSLPKGKYNRDYVLNLINTMLYQINQMKFRPSSIALSLTYSLEKLKTHIEMENWPSSGIYHEPIMKDDTNEENRIKISS